MKNPGCIIRLKDGRRVIMYNKQPLAQKGMYLLHLVDESLKPITDSFGKQKTLIRLTIKPDDGVIIGHVD